jgi:hypothetical protein
MTGAARVHRGIGGPLAVATVSLTLALAGPGPAAARTGAGAPPPTGAHRASGLAAGAELRLAAEPSSPGASQPAGAPESPAGAGPAASAAAPDAPAPSPSRRDALRALDMTGDPEARRRGVQMLAETGTMDDVPRLVLALRDPDLLVRALAERALWEVWSRSGDAGIDELLAIGIAQLTERQGEAAVETFTRIIERRPDFAEGWNKRATVYYLLGEYQRSLADCDAVIARNPHHYGALAGYGMIYLQLGEPEKALGYFERALAINPNLHQVEETVQELRRLLIQRRRDAA